MTDKEPLAYRMRPVTLEDIVGQEHVLGKDKILYNVIKHDRMTSLIIWGPPGCGKTSLTQVISNTTQYKTYKINAVTAGVGDIRQILEESDNLFMNPAGRSILIIDEIHRFNKAQQDILLPSVESGKIILIGTTTFNPYFSINKALISRSIVVQLQPLQHKDIIEILKKAVNSEKGLKKLNVEMSEEQYKLISEISSGDVRRALNGLELAVLSSKISKSGNIKVTNETIKESFQENRLIFDKNGDSHYDTISAFIKSIRGSDENASIIYLAKMLESGEDPMFIARRLVISAAEDIGLANPRALEIATNAAYAVKLVGMPEARIILSEATVYLAKSKKSNSTYMAINKAIQDVRTKDIGEIPMYLKNAPIQEMKKHGYAQGYKYPHEYKDGKLQQEYMPNNLIGKKYYEDKWGNDIYD